MKNTQRGFIIPLLIIAVLLIGGGVYIHARKVAAVKAADKATIEANMGGGEMNDNANVNVNTNTNGVSVTTGNSQSNTSALIGVKVQTSGGTNVQVQTNTVTNAVGGNVTGNANVKTSSVIKDPNPNVSDVTLTDYQIMHATYMIAARFDGKKTAAQAIVFPLPTAEHSLTGGAFISQTGSVQYNPANPTGEGFWITDYKYTDSGRWQAEVTITGEYGASAHDTRTFIVSKVDGKVVTQEK